MNKLWDDKAWDHYVYWQNQDRKTLNRINKLIKDIERNGALSGISASPKNLSIVTVTAAVSTRKIASFMKLTSKVIFTSFLAKVITTIKNHKTRRLN